jgi:hypothetical protein
MRKSVRRAAAVVMSALAPMAVVTIATPAVSSAQCEAGWWWDPVANVCRPPVVPPPPGCDNGWWWDPTANVCRPPLIPPPP